MHLLFIIDQADSESFSLFAKRWIQELEKQQAEAQDRCRAWTHLVGVVGAWVVVTFEAGTV